MMSLPSIIILPCFDFRIGVHLYMLGQGLWKEAVLIWNGMS